MKITSCSAFLTLLPPRPTRTLVETPPGSRTAHAGPGRGSRLHNCFATGSRFPASATTFPAPLGESCRNSKGCGGAAAAPFPGLGRRDTPPPGTAAPLGASLLPRRGADPSHSLRPATACPARTASSLPLSLSPCLPPGLPGRPRLPAPSGERAGAQLGGAAERGAGGGALPRPRGPGGGNPRLSPAAAHGAALSRLPVPPAGGGD